MRIHCPPESLSDLRSELLSTAAAWVRQAGEVEDSDDQLSHGRTTARATVLRNCGIQLRDLADKYKHYVEDAPHDGLMVTVCDQTSKQAPETMHVPVGDYALICCEPCHVAIQVGVGEADVAIVHRGRPCEYATPEQDHGGKS